MIVTVTFILYFISQGVPIPGAKRFSGIYYTGVACNVVISNKGKILAVSMQLKHFQKESLKLKSRLEQNSKL